MTESKKHICNVCSHSWDADAYPERTCPACGKSAQGDQTIDADAFLRADNRSMPTVDSDTADAIGDHLARTVENIVPREIASQLGETVVSDEPFIENQAPTKTKFTPPTISSDSIGMTIQAGRWAPSREEMRDIAATAPPELLERLMTTGIFSGTAADAMVNDNNKTVPQINETVDHSTAPPIGAASDKTVEYDIGATVAQATVDSSPQDLGATVDGSQSIGSTQPTVGRAQPTIGLGATIAGTDGTVDEASPAIVRGAKSDKTQANVVHTMAGSHARRPTAIDSVASSAAAAASNNQLEKTLVIQKRILRPESVDEVSDGEHDERSDYDLLRKLGEGGMGVVFSARQQSIRRVVALKMLKARSTHEVKQREKFLAEAVITGDLEHPNIVPIYDLGRDEEGAIFYAMKCVNGTPWDKLIHEKTQHENLEILMKVADAVAFAHSKNVIHRDLKPENVMLGDFGEVLVMDWGLAISTVAYNRFALGGTPAYMAPEMVLGPAEAIGVHSDIYLLGAILYEFVAGHRPHKGESISLCLMAAGRNEIIPTTKTGELIQIALKAMASEPSNRYASVRAMQDAIREYLSHTESIALATRAETDLSEALENNRYDSYARALFGFQEAITLWDGNIPAKIGASKAALAYADCARERGDYELGLSLLDSSLDDHQPLITQLQTLQTERDQRNQRLKAARRIGMALVATIFAIITTSFFWIRMEAERARKAETVAQNERADALFQKGVADEQRADALLQKKIADEQRTQAVLARQDEERQRMQADAARAAEQVARVQADNARMLADKKREEAEIARANEEAQRARAEEAKRREEYEGYVAKIGLAAAKIEENAYDRSLSLLDECPENLRHWEWGRLAYLCSRELQKFEVGVPLETLALSPDGKRFAVGGWGPDVLIFSFDQNQPVMRIQTDATQIFSLAFSPSGQQLAIGSNDSPTYLSVHDAQSGEKVIGLEGHKDAVLSVVWSKDGKQLLTGSYDNSARLWRVDDRTSQEFLGHDWWVWSATFSPDERRMVTTSQDGTAIVWDIQSGLPSPAFTSHQCPVLSANFAPDGKTIASGGYDGRVLIWDPNSLRGQDLAVALSGSQTDTKSADITSLSAHSDAVRSVSFSQAGDRLLTAGNDNVIRLWSGDDWSMMKEFRGHASRVAIAKFLSNQDQVVSASYDQSIKVWDVPNHKELDILGGSVLQGHLDSILGASFDPTGKIVVTASRDRSAIAWDIESGQPMQNFQEGHSYLASNAFFVPGGRQVLTVAIDNTARLWDVLTGTQAAVLEGTGIQAAAAVSPDGKWIATGSDRKSILIWNLAGNPIKEFDGFESDVTAIAIAPDGASLLVGDSIGRCQLIDAQSGRRTWVSRTHSRGITRVAFVPGTNRVLTASLDQVVAPRDLSTGTEDVAGMLKHPGPVPSMAVSKDGEMVATSCTDNKIRVWELNGAKVKHLIEAGEVACSSVQFSSDGKFLVAVMSDRKVRMWNLQSKAEVGTPGTGATPFLNLSKTTIPVWAAVFSENSGQLLTVGGTEARIWDVATGKTQQTFTPQSAVASVAFSPSGDRFVTGSWDNAARIWDLKSGVALNKLSGVHTRFVNTSVFSPDGQLILTASDDRTAGLWDAESGKLVGRLIGHTGRVTAASFSPDGTRVVTTSDDRTARIWDVKTLQTLFTLQGHSQAVLCAQYSPNGKTIVTGGDDTTAILWSADTGEALPFKLDGHTASITAVAFSPDSQRVFTGSKDTSAKLWDPKTGKEILTLTGHSQEITTVAVSPSGDIVLTAARDGTAILWPSVPWRHDNVQAERPAMWAKRQ